MDNQMNMVYHEEFGNLEIIMIDDKPYFPATACAKILGYANPRDAIMKHCKSDGVVKRDGVVTTTNQHGVTSEQVVSLKYINEGNLYRLIIRSKLPAAAKFERWVFEDVLPTIRKYGVYGTEAAVMKILSDPDFCYSLFCNLEAEQKKNAALKLELESRTQKASYYDNVLQSDNLILVTHIAKDYGCSAAEFNRLLYTLGIQYKVGGTWVLYQQYADKGYTQSRTYYTPAGEAVMHTCWTQKGREFLYDALAFFEIYPTSQNEDDEYDEYEYELDCE